MTLLLALLGLMGCLVGGPNNIITSAVATDLANDPVVKSKGQSAAGTVTGIINGSGSVTAAIGQLAIPVLYQMGLVDGVGYRYVWFFLIGCTITGTLLMYPKVRHPLLCLFPLSPLSPLSLPSVSPLLCPTLHTHAHTHRHSHAPPHNKPTPHPPHRSSRTDRQGARARRGGGAPVGGLQQGGLQRSQDDRRKGLRGFARTLSMRGLAMVRVTTVRSGGFNF